MRPSLTTPGHTRAASPTVRETDYRAIEERYGHLLAARLDTVAVVTKKWQDADLIWPHSDIDLRIILNEPPADWISFNEHLAQLQRDLVASDPVLRRVLEHPPGWVFLRSEVDAGLVPAAEMATWSHCFGEPTTVDRWKAHAAAQPWSGEDERFYRGIIAARVGGAYRLEADSADNVVLESERYGAHCVAWHYLAPVAFATRCLHERRRLSGKTEALDAHPSSAITEFLALARAGYRDSPPPEGLLTRAHDVVTTLPAPPQLTRGADTMPTAAEVVSAIGVLRCRVARYSYYLSPPLSAETGYLIDRETKDLHGAIRVLARCATLPAPLGALARRFRDLVPPPPTTRHTLRQFLNNAASHPTLIDELFSADHTRQPGLTP